MAKVVIKNVSEGRTFQLYTSCSLVDIFFNEKILDENKDTTQEKTLACIHWSDQGDNMTTHITVAQPHWRGHDGIDGEFCRNLISNRKLLHSYLRDIYNTLGAKLIRVTICPLVFIFAHEATQLFAKEGPVFVTKLKQLFSQCVTELPEFQYSFDEKHTLDECRSLHPSFSEQDPVHRLSAATPRCEPEMDLAAKQRFAMIDERMSEQSILIETQFAELEKQNEELMTLLACVSEEMNKEYDPTHVQETHSAENVCVQGPSGAHPKAKKMEKEVFISQEDKKRSKPDTCASKPVTKDDTEGHLQTSLPARLESTDTRTGTSSGQTTFSEKKTFEESASDSSSVKVQTSLSHPDGIRSSSTGKAPNISKDEPPFSRKGMSSARAHNSSLKDDRYVSKEEKQDVTIKDTGRTKQTSWSPHTSPMREREGELDNIQFIVDEHSDRGDPMEAKLWAGVNDALTSEAYMFPRAPKGMSTVLCLDTSGSVDKDALAEMKAFVSDFLRGIEDIAENNDIEENIALVTFGGTAKILHHLTNDYSGLRDSLDTISSGGTTPLRQALLVALACLTTGGTLRIGPLEVLPRIVFITDGRASSHLDEHGQDTLTANSQEKLLMVRVMESIVTNATTVWIPIGNADTGFMQSLVTLSQGQLLECKDVRKLYNYQRLRRTAYTVIKAMRGQDIDGSQLGSMIDVFGGNLEASEKEEVQSLILENVYSMDNVDYSSTDSFDNIRVQEELLPLGSRVIRGPDWKWGNQDSEGPGTIINHQNDGGYVYVLWDNGESNVYRYGIEGAYDVLADDDHPRDFSSEKRPEIGVQVERGPDWLESYENQDGGPGKHGVIIRKSGHKVMVRWDNGNIHTYRFGEDGKFDLIMRDPVRCLMEASAKASNVENRAAEEKLDMEANVKSYIWQRLDKHHEWQNYSPDENVKITQAFEKGSKSCLINRNNKSYRICFRDEIEREVGGNKTMKIRRVPADL